MKKRFYSDYSPSELMKTRIILATVIALVILVKSFISLPEKAISKIVIFCIIPAIPAWIILFFVWHRLTIWLERKFFKK